MIKNKKKTSRIMSVISSIITVLILTTTIFITSSLKSNIFANSNTNITGSINKSSISTSSDTDMAGSINKNSISTDPDTDMADSINKSSISTDSDTDMTDSINKSGISTDSDIDTTNGHTKNNKPASEDNTDTYVKEPKMVTDELGLVTGKLAMLNSDVQLKNAYMVTLDKDDNYISVNLEDMDYFLNKNDMVIVLAQNDTSSRIMPVSGDIPAIRGTIDNKFISYDLKTFTVSANQAMANNIMGYNDINGNETGMQNGRGMVIERRNGWALLSIAGSEYDIWFKADELSYNFDTVDIIDAVNMPIE